MKLHVYHEVNGKPDAIFCEKCGIAQLTPDEQGLVEAISRRDVSCVYVMGDQADADSICEKCGKDENGERIYGRV